MMQRRCLQAPAELAVTATVRHRDPLAWAECGAVVSDNDAAIDAAARIATRLGTQRDRAAESCTGDNTQVWQHARGLS